MAEEAAPQDSCTPFAILAWSHSGASLISRRSQAVAEYWAAMARAHEPEEAARAQIDYWRHLVDDYTLALSEAAAPFVSAPGEEAASPH